ncbi:MAG: hypothetical protein ACXVQY_02080 [Actinomycetota bacterium]
MTSRIARPVAAVALGALLSACQMTVQVSTRVNGNGSGTLGLRMTIDKELRDALESSKGGAGITSINDLFERLRATGWSLTKKEPSGGLDLLATRSFRDKKSFDAVLGELSGGGGGALGALGYSLGYTTHSSFLKTKTDFTGHVDTSALLTLVATTVTNGDRKVAQQILQGAGDNFRFELRASLPGAVSIHAGDGTVTNGVAVWRPALGSSVDIAASSSALKTGSLLLVGIPALLVLAGVGWFLIGRRQKTLIPEAPTPADRRRERARRGPSEPAEQLLAIIPDQPGVIETATTTPEQPERVIDLDVPVPDGPTPVQPTQEHTANPT